MTKKKPTHPVGNVRQNGATVINPTKRPKLTPMNLLKPKVPK